MLLGLSRRPLPERSPGGIQLNRPIYLDHHATTPLDRRVLDAMLPYLTEEFGNPHSVDHRYGWAAQAAVEGARREVAKLVGARPQGIVFTSGATEANNIALLGLRLGPRRHVVASAVEHASVRGCLAELERRGARVTFVPVETCGRVLVERLAASISADTGLISVMAANHEIGTLQPIAAVGRLARAKGIVFHTDATQAVGKVPIDVGALPVDLMSFSAHKFHGPKGVGALYVAEGVAERLEPVMHGGGQERGLRPGTLAVPQVVGFGAAAAIAREEGATERARLAALRDELLRRLRARPGLRVYGTLDARLAGNLNVGWPGIVAQDLLHELRDEVAASTGSACASAGIAPSPVLLALGLDDEAARGGLRIGLGRGTTEDEVARAAAAILAAAAVVAGG